MLHTLIYTDGYGIYSIAESTDIEEIKQRLQEAYTDHIPDQWNPDYKEISYLSDTDAILYANGDDVYVWAIFSYGIANLPKRKEK